MKKGDKNTCNKHHKKNEKTPAHSKKNTYTNDGALCYNDLKKKPHELLSPQNDYVFKRIFGDRRNVDILADFLKAALDLPPGEYESLTFADPHLNMDEDSRKLSILDVRVHTKSGRAIHVEIQVLPVPNMRERIVFCTSRLITGQIGSGDDYIRIQPVVSILITGHRLFKDDEEYRSRFILYDPEKNIPFSDRLEIRVFELPKVPIEGEGTALWPWMMFLKSNEKEELSMLAEKNPSIKKAVGLLMEMSEDESERMIAEYREKVRRDEASRLNGAYERGVRRGLAQGTSKGRKSGKAEGRAEGKAEGLSEARREMARKALQKGLDTADITDITGLSREEIETLR